MSRENAVGRRLDDGGPVTGGGEFDGPDLEALDDLGFHVIEAAAHIRRDLPERPGERFYRHGYNYDDAVVSDGTSDTGLLFIPPGCEEHGYVGDTLLEV